MKKMIVVLSVVLLAGIVTADTFESVASARFWGKTSIPRLTRQIDANNAAIDPAFVSIAAEDQTGLTNTVTIVVTDVDGAGNQVLANWWLSSTALGAASTNNIESVTLTSGTAIVTADLAKINPVVPDTDGEIVANVLMTAAGTNYLNVVVGSVQKSVAIVTEDD